MEAATPLAANDANMALYMNDPRPHPAHYAPQHYDAILNGWYTDQIRSFAEFRRYANYLFRCRDWLFKMLFHDEYRGSEAWVQNEIRMLLDAVCDYLKTNFDATDYANKPNATLDFRHLLDEFRHMLLGPASDVVIQQTFIFFALSEFPPFFRSLMNDDPDDGVVVDIMDRAALAAWFTSFVRPGAKDLVNGLPLIDYYRTMRGYYATHVGILDYHQDLSYDDLDLFKEMALDADMRRFIDVSYSHQESALVEQRQRDEMAGRLHATSLQEKERRDFVETRDNDHFTVTDTNAMLDRMLDEFGGV